MLWKFSNDCRQLNEMVILKEYSLNYILLREFKKCTKRTKKVGTTTNKVVNITMLIKNKFKKFNPFTGVQFNSDWKWPFS